MKKTAIIDLGSNSIRMSIFEDKNGICTETAAYRSVIRLSEGMNLTGYLTAEARLRAVRALSEYKSIMTAAGVECVRAAATAAVRKAKNREEFLREVHDTVGIEIEVIDGEREAYYDYLAVREKLGISRGIICDIGGGSTEIIAADGGSSPSHAVSIPYGSRSICEMFLEGGETAEALSKARLFISEQLDTVDWLKDFKETSLIGIGGCMRALAKLELSDSGKGLIECHRTSAARLSALAREIEKADASAREAMPGIGKERADIIMGGVLLASEICCRIAPSEIIVADVGVRDGIIADMRQAL